MEQRLIDADAYEHAVQGNPYVSDSMKTYVRCSIQSQPTIDAVPKEKILLFLNIANEELSKAHADKSMNGIMTWSASVTTLEGLLKEYDTEDTDIVEERRMKRYICKEVPTENGGYLEIEKELIRCRDCKYYKWEIDMCNREGATVFPMNVVHEEDYCSRAERKEE